jgi:hypothetical protein
MKLRFLIIPVLVATTLLAQGPPPGGGRGFGGGNPGNPPPPPSPSQLATRELQLIAAFLGLDSTQTAALLGNPALPGQLTAEQTTLQADAAALKTFYSALATQLAGSPAGPVDFTALSSARSADLAARETAANDVLAALGALSPPLTAVQIAKLPRVVGLIANGGMSGPGRSLGLRF